MAETLQFVRGATTLSLNAAAGFSLGNDSYDGNAWTPKVAISTPGRIPPYIIEEIPVRVAGASSDLLAGYLQSLAEMAEGAARYFADRNETTPVWLVDQTAGETGQRRALVKSITVSPDDGWHQDASNPNIMFCTLAVERHPYWEAATPAPSSAVAGVSVVAGIADYTAGGGTDLAGHVPGRLQILDAKLQAAGASDYYQFWLGWRSANKHAGLADFVELLELEDFDMAIGGDCAVSADATASPGGAGNTRVTCTFATAPGWAARVVGDEATWAIDPASQAGTCKALLRAKVDAGTVAEVYLQWGHWGSMAVVENQPIRVASSTWAVYDLQQFTTPFRDLRIVPYAVLPAVYDGSFDLAIWARRVSGGGNLYLDCLTLLPTDEYFLHMPHTRVYHSIGVDLHMCVAVSPEETLESVTYEPTAFNLIYDHGSVSASGAGVPVGDGRLYIVGARADGTNLLQDILDLTVTLVPRWSSLRGAE